MSFSLRSSGRLKLKQDNIQQGKRIKAQQALLTSMRLQSIQMCVDCVCGTGLYSFIYFTFFFLLLLLIAWLAPSPHSERVPGSAPGWGLSVWSLHVLPVYAWVLSGYSGFLTPSKNMHVRLIGDSKLSLRLSVCVVVCLVCLCVAL